MGSRPWRGTQPHGTSHKFLVTRPHSELPDGSSHLCLRLFLGFTQFPGQFEFIKIVTILLRNRCPPRTDSGATATMCSCLYLTTRLFLTVTPQGRGWIGLVRFGSVLFARGSSYIQPWLACNLPCTQKPPRKSHLLQSPKGWE